MRIFVPLRVAAAVRTPGCVRAGYLFVGLFEFFIKSSVPILPGRSRKFSDDLFYYEKAPGNSTYDRKQL